MSARAALLGLACAFLAPGCSREVAGAEQGSGASERRTNLVVIVIDTLRADLGRAGVDGVQTPNLDRLAEDGIAFPKAFSHAPMTLPAHTSLFSSRLPSDTLVVNNGDDIPEDLPLLPQHLAERGYATHGVISLSTLCTSHAPARSVWSGFDTFATAGSRFAGDGEEVNRELLPLMDTLEGDQPFFLFAHYSDPHEPYDAHGTAEHTAELFLDGELAWTVPTSQATYVELERELAPGKHRFEVRGREPFVLRKLAWTSGGAELGCRPIDPAPPGPRREAVFEVSVGEARAGKCLLKLYISDHVRRVDLPRRYALEVEFADAQVGVLLDALRARGLYDDALIVLTSDHGESLGERPRIGHVQTLFDEAIRVPLIVKLPAGSRAEPALRMRARTLAGHLDLVPTVLELLDLPVLPGQQGKSWLAPRPPEPMLSETHRPEALHDLSALRDERFKLIYVADEQRFELYDLEADPGETRDVFAELGAERAEWQVLLRERAERLAATRSVQKELSTERRDSLRALGYATGEEQGGAAADD